MFPVDDVSIIEENSDRPNILYQAIKAPTSIAETFSWLVEKLRHEEEHMDKHLIYCRSIKACSAIYHYFMEELQEAAHIGNPGVRNRLLAMFHRSTCERVKKYVMDTFGKHDSKIRMIICTVAFGMGVDTPDVNMVLHWGAPRTFEGFFQQLGRAGRDTSIMPQAHSLLYYHMSDISTAATDSLLRQYCLNEKKKCRRQILTEYFSPSFQVVSCNQKHTCCDFCYPECDCGLCFPLPGQLQPALNDQELERFGRMAELYSEGTVRSVTGQQEEMVRRQLLKLQEEMTIEGSLVSSAILTGLDHDVINDIVTALPHIHEVNDLLTDYVYNRNIASRIMDIISASLIIT